MYIMYHMYIRHKQFAKKITLHFGFDQSLIFYLISCHICSFQLIGRCLKTKLNQFCPENF